MWGVAHLYHSVSFCVTLHLSLTLMLFWFLIVHFWPGSILIVTRLTWKKIKVKSNCTGLSTVCWWCILLCRAQITSWCSVQSAGSDLDLLCFVLLLVHVSSCTLPPLTCPLHSSCMELGGGAVRRHLVMGNCNYRDDIHRLEHRYKYDCKLL